jgi:hypothetical protein
MEEFKNHEEYRRYQTEWALVNLVRELRCISNKGALPTYYSAIKLASQVMPEIFDENSHMVKRHHEPEIIRSYRQQAAAETKIAGKEVTPIEMLDKRIDVLTKQIATDIEYKDLLLKELDKLRAVRSLFLPKRVQEDYILEHDVKSMKFGAQPIEIKAKSADYLVAENRVIRCRLIHPNEGEQSMGADLIYEQYDPEKRKVRFLMIQYKIWDGEILYWSQAKNMEPQLKKMNDNLCANGYCNCEDGKKTSDEFRYPFCSAFLRPTDRLQYKDSPLTSSGMHIPICKIDSVAVETKEGNKVLRRNNMKNTSLSQQIFEECFNHNQIGSRWMNYSEAEKLYQEHKILESDERIILHVQELEI